MAASTEKLDVWRSEALAQWVDERSLTRASIDVWWWFFENLYADLAQIGAVFRGVSWRADDEDCLMVLKVLQGGLPGVVFTGSLTPTRCMAKLRRQIRDGSAKVLEDKYA